jgi:hypothetical protein
MELQENTPSDIDLSAGRTIDLLFSHWAERDGMEYAIKTWRWHDEFEKKLKKDRATILAMARRRFYSGGRITYKQIGAEFGVPPLKVSKLISPVVEELREAFIENRNKIEAAITTPSEELKYVMDKRVILQENCALLMGGDEIKNVLNQLANL